MRIATDSQVLRFPTPPYDNDALGHLETWFMTNARRLALVASAKGFGQMSDKELANWVIVQHGIEKLKAEVMSEIGRQ